MTFISRYIQVAIPVPMRQSFTYLAPEHLNEQTFSAGDRVLVPFGSRKLIAIVLKVSNECDVADNKLKAIVELLPSESKLSSSQIDFLSLCARYYHHPIGDVISQALPVLLRQIKPVDLTPEACWFKNPDKSEQELELLIAKLAKSAAKQKALYQFISEHGDITWPEIRMAGFIKSQLTALMNKELICQGEVASVAFKCKENSINVEDKHQLSVEQAVIVSGINQQLNKFSCHLIDGITGSGKTEVYLQIIEEVLKQDKQVLVLVPEIGLTPQTLSRFEKRFRVPIVLHHSGLNDNERLQTWHRTKKGEAAIVIATRSGVFSPLQAPGLIVIDEEHDGSFKQQEGFRYHARDVAILRARQLNIPVVLGTATPSLETLQNALSGKYQYHQLTKRAGKSNIAGIELIDMAKQQIEFGLSGTLKKAIQDTLERGEQVLIFLNRRGYAPAISCQECNWIAECKRCDKPYTLHQNQGLLVCHHCGSQKRIMPQCGECGSIRIKPLGQGTEQLEQRLVELFPDFSAVRIDRDSTRRKGELAKLLEQVSNKEHQILVGTQMLAKGHHFPDVTLVAVLDVDGALFSYDFRAPEHMAQLLVQVSGRAGRASKPGKVMVQTQYPEHPLLQDLVHNGYQHFARYALMEREQARIPPFGFQALFRAEANSAGLPSSLLRDISEGDFEQCLISGPIAAAQEKKAGKFRFHLLLQASDRKYLHSAVQVILLRLEKHKLQHKVRWSVDIDPQELSW
ncbi:primosomal protein N' [Thalassomonas sp. M1454]|uniref:primosomal protein N' n=1 Tax=Thalassomonas sp. M1454 TaxID=2594477 RepID=UPI00117E2C2C|nr:primosomal protein N' [Thalassomonas sp. M1454]TRX53415.1 primosomal protein N' [Thalassomonas sp. M1454]